MSSKEIQKLIKEISELFKSNYPDFKGIYYYGSRVRGDFNIDSDYDLLFVFDRKINWQFKEEIKHTVYEYEDKYNIFIDAKVVSSYEIDTNRMPLIQDIKNYSIFYGAG